MSMPRAKKRFCKGFYNWLKQKNTEVQETSKERLKKRIRLIFEESREIYGSAKIQKKLEREGLIYSRSYISYLMKEMGLRSVVQKK